MDAKLGTASDEMPVRSQPALDAAGDYDAGKVARRGTEEDTEDEDIETGLDDDDDDDLTSYDDDDDLDDDLSFDGDLEEMEEIDDDDDDEN